MINLLHELRYIVTYDEVRRFKISAAKYVGEKGFNDRGLTPKGGTIGPWIDNYDLNVFTPNGRRETHALAIEFTQHPSENQTDEDLFRDALNADVEWFVAVSLDKAGDVKCLSGQNI